MIRVGLTGGIASGKTLVCGILEAKGCTIIDADTVAHELIRHGRPAYQAVINLFGRSILGANDEIDRAKLGAVVFSDSVRLDQLNRVVHPEVIQAISAQLDRIELETPKARVIVDASLMIESGFHSHFQCLVLVTCTLQQQIDRLKFRNSLSEALARERIALQMPLQDKLRYADYVVDNSGDVESTRRQVDRLFETLERTVWTV